MISFVSSSLLEVVDVEEKRRKNRVEDPILSHCTCQGLDGNSQDYIGTEEQGSDQPISGFVKFPAGWGSPPLLKGERL